jgi:hypothetical protein
LAILPPAAVAWHVVQAMPLVLRCGRLAIPACVVAVVAGGLGIVKPPTLRYIGAPRAPSQFRAVTVPVPGHEWQALQSSVPEALVNEL